MCLAVKGGLSLPILNWDLTQKLWMLSIFSFLVCKMLGSKKAQTSCQDIA